MTSRTRWLALVALLLLALNLLDRKPPADVDTAPVLAAVTREAVTRIELSDASEKTVLKQVEGRWRVTAPYEGDADQASVRSLVLGFRKETPVDVLIDSGNLDQYGLQPGEGIVVELFTTGDEPDISFTVGNDAVGGSSFIRISGSDAVYRARVGGRARYARTPADWRNKVLLDEEPNLVTGLTLRRTDFNLVLQRGPSPGNDDEGKPKPGPWTLVPPPPWPVDQRIAEGLISTLGHLRAGAVAGPETDGGFSPPLATFELDMADGSSRALIVGTRQEESTSFAKVEGREEVYRTAGNLRVLAGLLLDDLRDKTLLNFSRDDVDTLGFAEGSISVLLRQDLATHLWQVISPPNVDVDIKSVFFAVNTLAGLRADAAANVSSLAAAGLDRPATRIVVTFVDGSSTSLEIGGPTTDMRGRPARYIRRAGSDDIFVLRDETVAKLKAAFGR